MSRSWLLLTIPVALAAIALLSRTALSLLRSVRGSVIASVPIRSEQQLTINSSGDFALNLEAPTFTSHPASLSFSLAGVDPQSTIALHPIAFRTELSSMSRARLELYSFTIPSPGTYTLRVAGLNPATDYSTHAIVITRQYRGALVLHVIALIALGVLLIGSIVISGLIWSGKSLTPVSANSPAPYQSP